VLQPPDLEIDQDKTLQQKVVKHQVDEEML
jgi:hypothetical protein